MSNTDYRVTWGSRLRELRNLVGLSQMALAAQVEIDKGYYARIERGETGVSDDVKLRLAAAFGVQVAEIFAYPDPATYVSLAGKRSA